MYSFPVAAVIAVPTLIGLLFTSNINRSFLKRETILLAGLWLWFGVTFLHALQVPFFQAHIDDSRLELIRVSKVLLITFVMILLVTSYSRFKSLVIVTALSFGALALKGTIFGLRTSGESRVWGPPDSFIADNNAFALAVNMSLPMLFFLARDEKKRLYRWLYYLAFACGVFSVLLTYSRGGQLGLVVVLLAITFKSHYKVIALFLGALAFIAVITFAPPQWMARMGGLAREKWTRRDGKGWCLGERPGISPWIIRSPAVPSMLSPTWSCSNGTSLSGCRAAFFLPVPTVFISKLWKSRDSWGSAYT